MTPDEVVADRATRSSTRASSSSRSRSIRRDPLESIRRLQRTIRRDVLIGAGTVTSARAGATSRRRRRPAHRDAAQRRRRRARGEGERDSPAFPASRRRPKAFAALANGADALKLFPAELLTPAVLRSMRSVLPAGDALPPRRRDITGHDGGVCCRRRGGLRARLRAVPARRRRRARVARTRATSSTRGVACAASHLDRSHRLDVTAFPPPMKITKLTTFVVPPRWCFLKIETDEGITGWGEPVLEGRAHTVAAAVDGAGRLSHRQGSVARSRTTGPSSIAAASIAAAACT